MLPLVRGVEVLVFLAIARLWHPELRGADKNELLNVLWPNVAEARARRNLSTALSHLRTALAERHAPTAGQLHLEQEGERLLLNDEVCISDVGAFCDLEEQVLRASADLDTAVAAYGGPLLPHARRYQTRRGAEAASGLPLGWLDEAPAQAAAGKLEDRLRGLLLRRARQLCTLEPWTEAADVCRNVLSTGGRLLQPPNPRRAEEAAVGMLEAVAAQGDETALAAAYEMLQTSMPYGVSAQLQERYETLAARQPLATPTASASRSR
jgi:DNA-binding SARP family transcriptional activator